MPISEVSEFSILPYTWKRKLGILGKFSFTSKPFIEFEINIPHVLMSIDTSHNKYIFLPHGNILNIYFWWRKKYVKRLLKTKHNIDIKYGIAYCRILKRKSFLKNEKVADRKLGNLRNLGNIIPSFLVSEFSVLPYSQDRKLGFKNLGKKFPRFPRFPSFRPGPLWHEKS